MILLGDGPLRGWTFEAAQRGQREKTLRTVFLQLLLYQADHDLTSQWDLLNWRPDPKGPPIALDLAQGILELYESLGDEYRDGAHPPWRKVRAAGFCLLREHVDEAILAAQEKLGQGSVDDIFSSGLVYVAWDSGEMLAFQRSKDVPALWRDYTAEALRERSEDTDPGGEAPDGPGFSPLGQASELVQPTPRQVELLQAAQAPAVEGGPDGLDAATVPETGSAPGVPGAEHLLEGRAQEAFRLTLELAKKKADPGTIWDELHRSKPEIPPGNASCCSCAVGFSGCDHAFVIRPPGGATHWGHPWCVERELADQAERAAVAPTPPAPAKDPGPNALDLALGCADLKPFKARHKGDDPGCLICIQPVKSGQLCRKKSPTSSKRLHDACVLGVLNAHQEAAS